ncbi:transcriptional activator domain-containing protein [Desulfovibrio sp. X2]|uniref:tetratricopeptide repeat protein n=1 Tax=Desulfovibrio sp. X2 TaxID=941449 RepID=UPI000358B183|nr:tetratricopeptide repeat protein [Desulfovibrio sp. X2]EPR42792.1 transcriptional activator domain-containing protein [Desulfovibrio sp. X2]
MSPETSKQPSVPSFAAELGLPDWLAANLKPIVAAMITAVIVAGAIGIWDWQKERSTSKANDELGTILLEKTGTERVKALEAFAAGAPASVRVNALFSLADAAMQAKQYDAAAAAYATLAKETSPALSVAATLGQAGALLQAGKAKESLGLLLALKDKAPAGFNGIVAMQTAAAAEAAGDPKAALAAYEALQAQSAGNPNPYFESKIAQFKAQTTPKS